MVDVYRNKSIFANTYLTTTMVRLVKRDELAKHSARDDLWVAIYGDVYNLTEFAGRHPGGRSVILNEAGSDGTGMFRTKHPKEILEKLKPCIVGQLERDTEVKENTNKSTTGIDLKRCLSLDDIETYAKSVMKDTSYAYYATGCEDELTLRSNRNDIKKFQIVPRNLVSVSNINTNLYLLGFYSSLPIFISPCALGGLAHEDAEVCLANAAYGSKIIQICPQLASKSLTEMRVHGDQTQFIQMYLFKDRKMTLDLIERIESLKYKAIIITIDSATVGKRETDIRAKFNTSTSDRVDTAPRSGSSIYLEGITLEHIKWLHSKTKLPIILKGIQNGDDAVAAVQSGLTKGLMISNHGGRNLDTSRSSIQVLVEVVARLKTMGLYNKIPLFVDGGFRRGSDIFKAIAIGANAVGIGRPMLYSMAIGGQEGVQYALNLLREELVTCMKNAGCETISSITSDFVSCSVNDLQIPLANHYNSVINSSTARL